MTTRSLFLVAALLLSTFPTSPRAQTAETEAAQPFSIALRNDGASAVELLWADGEGQWQPLDIVLEPGWERAFEAWPGTEIAFRETDAAADELPFYPIVIGAEAPVEPIVIPDARLFRPALLTVVNGLEVAVDLSLPPPDDAAAEWAPFDRLAAGESAPFEIYPLTSLVLLAEDQSLMVAHEVGLEAEQTLDLWALANPDAPMATVTIDNTSTRHLVLEEQRPGIVQRVGMVEPEQALEVEVIVGADLRIAAGDGEAEEIGLHHVTAAEDQIIAIEDTAEEGVVIPPAAGVDLSLLPEASRASAAGFLERAGAAFAEREDVTVYVAYNGGESPIWFAGLSGEEITGAKQIAPGAIGNIIASVGNFSIAWPGDVPPEAVTRDDVFASILVAKDMPEVVDVSPPAEITVSIESGVCKPVDLFRVDAFGEESRLAAVAPLTGTEPLQVPAGSYLVARAGAASQFAGRELWSGQLGDAAEQQIMIEPTAATGYDPMLVSTAGGAERTVHLHNSTSRGLHLFQLDAEGREIMLTVAAPIPAGVTETFYLLEGTVLVFRRPNVPPRISEYARMRVGEAPNQELDIGAMTGSQGIVGAWMDLARPAIAQANDVGTTFLSFVAEEGLEISGSTNVEGAARFEGCADNHEAFGYWIPEASVGFTCAGDVTHTDRAGGTHASFGRFAAQRTAGGELILRRGYCEAEPTEATTWYRLPQHYDDMDPSTEAFQTGYFNLAWAPRSFDWVGRGFDLLRTDPLDYQATEPGLNSDSPLFDFVFEDRAGSANQIATKSIFGVRYLNQTGRSDSCDRDEKMVRSLEDLSEFSSRSYSGSVGVPAVASFSLSRSHQRINTAATGKERLFIMERCDARLHALKMDLRWNDRRGEDSLRQPLERSFRNAVGQLPLEWGDGRALLGFLDRFGTHFSERIVYGGTFFAETEVSKATYQIAEQQGETLSLAAEGTLKKVSLGGTFEQEDRSGRGADNAHSSSSYRKWSVGGTGSSIYDVWSASVADSPAPIDVGFRPIYDILTPVFFPDDPAIGVKNALLRQATAQYFRQYGRADLTSDPRALGVRDPRSVCVQMEAVEYSSSSGRDGDKFVSELYAGFVDRDKGPVTGVERLLLVDFLRNLNDFKPSERNFPPRCTAMVDDAWAYTGSIFLHGDVGQYRDGAGGASEFVALSEDFPEAEHTFSLRRLEPGIKQTFEGTIGAPLAGQARYRLAVWLNGTI